TGLGSSASVCVNMLKTITSYLQMHLSKHDLAEKAFHIARHVLGRHVGKQDEFAAAFGGLNYITFHRDGSTDVEPLQVSNVTLNELQSNLMLFFTGSAHHSWTILEDQEKATRKQSSPATNALHQIHRFAQEMREALEQHDL